MANRPEDAGSPYYFPWASSAVQQVIIKNGEPLSLDNKAQPLAERTTFGFKYGEEPNFQEINYQFDGYSLWFQHLDQRYAVGDLHHTRSAETVPQISARLGGTWALLDTQTIGGQTVYIYEKTA